MPESASQQQASSAWQILIERARLMFWPPRVPDHVPSRLTPHEEWLLRLERIRDLLEQTRASLARDGWTSGAWFSVDTPDGAVRQVSTAEAISLSGPGAQVRGACLVGAMLRVVDDADTAPSVADAWGCVDELYEAIHERMGHQSLPAGRSYAHDQRRVHLQVLTAWNDAEGRRLDEVLDLIDRAVSRIMLAACLEPAR
jgi:hypothetical protein